MDGSKQLTVTGIDPVSISTDFRDGSVWVADYDNNRLVKFLPGVTDGYGVGTDTGAHIVINGFKRPKSVSVNPETGVIWVADMGSNRVVRLTADVPDGYNIGTDTEYHSVKTGFSSPYCVSVNKADGTLWVADYGNHQVVKLSASGNSEVVRLGGFNHPVFSLMSTSLTDLFGLLILEIIKLFALPSDGALVFRIDGFNNPSTVGANPLDGSWVGGGQRQ